MSLVPNYRIQLIMGGEIFTAAFLSFTLILVGIGLGYLLLKLAPD